MKNILTILVFIFISCGTRKTELEKTDNIKIENTYSQGSKIVLGNTFTYTPFDNGKPMVIEGKKYNNAIISNDKSKIIEKYKYKNIVKTIVTEKIKAVTRTNHDFLWFGIAFIVVLAIFMWFKMGNIRF